MELNKPLVVKNVLMIMDHFMRYALAVVMKDQTAKTVMKVFYKCFIAGFGVPMKLLSDRVPTLHPPYWRNFVPPSASKSAVPPLTMPSAMGKWNAFTKCCSTGLANWSAIRRPSGNNTYWSSCRHTIAPGWW